MGEILTEGTITYYSHFKITIMKVYNITNRISTQARQELTNIIDTHEKYKNSYFFHPSPNAAGRRYNENRFKEAHPKVSFFERRKYGNGNNDVRRKLQKRVLQNGGCHKERTRRKSW